MPTRLAATATPAIAPLLNPRLVDARTAGEDEDVGEGSSAGIKGPFACDGEMVDADGVVDDVVIEAVLTGRQLESELGSTLVKPPEEGLPVPLG